jgi:hypothetical protein
MSGSSIWTAPDRSRWFLIPDDLTPVTGDLEIRNLVGEPRHGDPDWLTPYEITEAQARLLARDQLAHTLDELKTNIDGGLAKFRAQLEAKDQKPIDSSSPITPNAASVILDFLKALPRVVGQGISGDDTRVAAARETMVTLQERLKESGVDVDDRLQQFPGCLAELRKAPGKKEDD